MSKLPYLACIAASLLLGAKPQNEMFAKYKAIEVYEVRPDIFATPRYAADGKLCEIGFEKPSYSPGIFRTLVTFDEKEIDSLVDEFAPPDVRGPESKDFLRNEEIIEGPTYRPSYIRNSVYENVTVSISGIILTRPEKGHASIAESDDLAFTITWPQRKCQ